MDALKCDNAQVALEAAQALAKLGPAGLSIVRECISGRDIAHRRIATQALRLVPIDTPNVVIGPLKSALRDSDITVRANAAFALSEIGVVGETAGALDDLITLMHEPIRHVRFSAARALGSLGPIAQPAVPLLIEASRDPDWCIRNAAVKALGATLDRRGVDALIAAAVGDEDMAVRQRAIESLGKLGNIAASARPALEKIIADGANEISAPDGLAEFAISALALIRQNPH